jgi:diguanylate cyclase (GGDEF)-like protein
MNRAIPTTPPLRDRPSSARRYSIRTSLAALVTACLLPSLAALGGIVYEDHLQRRDAVERETMLRAKGLLASIDRDLAMIQASLEVLAASGRLADADPQRFVERLHNTPRSLVLLNYVLVDRQGHELIDTAVPEGQPLPSGALTPSIRHLFETGQAVVSPLYEGSGHHQPCIALSVPVRRYGEVIYALTAELSPVQLGAILVREPLPDEWVAALLDRDNTIIARSRSGWRYIGHKTSDALVRTMATQPEGVHEGINKEGVPVLASYTSSPLSGLRLVINAPRAQLLSKLSSSFALLIGCGGLALVVALWFASRLAGGISRSVAGLIPPALALGTGKPVEVPDSTLKEVDAVAHALVQAAEMLAQANHQAHHDALTGLCNRLLFDELAAHRIAAVQRIGTRLAILAIDLDHFKDVNDQHGHAAGDRVLTTAAQRIRDVIRGADVVSRRGGDEFTVLLDGVDAVLAGRLAGKLVAALAKPYDRIVPSVSASIGVALFPDSGTTLPALLERADDALYDAKKAGKGRVAGDVVVARGDLTWLGAAA